RGILLLDSRDTSSKKRLTSCTNCWGLSCIERQEKSAQQPMSTERHAHLGSLGGYAWTGPRLLGNIPVHGIRPGWPAYFTIVRNRPSMSQGTRRLANERVEEPPTPHVPTASKAPKRITASMLSRPYRAQYTSSSRSHSANSSKDNAAPTP